MSLALSSHVLLRTKQRVKYEDVLAVLLDATRAVERMYDAWRTRGIKNRIEFFRRALGHYLDHQSLIFRAKSA